MNRLINASFLTRSRKGIFPSLNQRTPTAVPFSHISSIVGIDYPSPTITSNFLVMVNNANCNSDERGLSHKNNFMRPMALESQYPPFLNSARNVYHGGKSEFLLCTTGREIGQYSCDALSNNHNNLESIIIQTMGRNSRNPKKANKGSRPCSRAGRRRRKEKIGKRKR